MKVKTSELTDNAIDWAVCIALGRTDMYIDTDDGSMVTFLEAEYSTEWELGGPLIEQKKIETYFHGALEMWAARHDEVVRYGPTLLMAAMRCFVASRLGDEVEIPDELI